MTERWYVSPSDGKKYRLIEANQDRLISTKRIDFLNGIIGDSMHCLIANAAVRMPEVLEAFIGTGHDSVLVEKIGDEIVAVHYVNSAGFSRVRDAFDQDQDLESYLITLRKPAPSETYDARTDRFKRVRAIAKLQPKPNRKVAVQAKGKKKLGMPAPEAKYTTTKSRKVKSWPQPKVQASKSGTKTRRTRVERLGVPHRARLPIVTTL